MRDIKFRAWIRSEQNSNGGFFVMSPESSAFGLNLFRDKHVGCVLQQYTGLKDKDGKEIYEGDIVHAYTLEWKTATMDSKYKYKHIGVVRYEPPAFFIKIKVGFSRNWIDFKKEAEPYEVIGNIYENPTLLESAGKDDV